MVRIAGLLSALVVLAALPATAQTRLLALFSGTYPCSALGCPAGTLLDIDAERGVIKGTASVSPGWGFSLPGVTPDGRYFVFGGYRSPGAHLDALDTMSYQVTSFPVTIQTPAFGYAVHPSTLRAYFQRPDDEQVFVVDDRGVRAFQGLGARPGILRFVSGDGSRLVLHRHLTDEVAVVDSETGTTRGVVADAFGVAAVNADGTEIYAFGRALSRPLERRAVSSGAVLATTPLRGAGNVTFARDPRSGHIWQASGGLVRVLDRSTLATIAEFTFEFGTAPLHLAFDPERPIAFIGWKATSEADNLPAHFVVLDTDTMAVRAAADIALPGLGYVSALVLAPRPPRVEALSATVNGPAVTLTWTNGASQALATHLIVEAGSASGLTDLARIAVPTGRSSLVVPHVPSGTYFVRVRSANATGEGAASNEITVSVP
jgi:hypothetical protein